MSLPPDDSRVIREREIINVFLACGVYENIAKDIVKTTPELALMTEKSADVFKSVLREALSILEKEGVPDIKLAEEPTNQISDTPRKVKLNLCKICKDSAAIHASFPDIMRKFFRRTQKFRGELAKDDWLCKSCYADWYREYREDIAEIQAGSYVDQKPEEEVLPDDNEEEKKRQPKKEFYVKTIVLLLWQVVRFLDPKAISHRKMLIRYIAKNQIHLNQMGTVLWYLRKVGNGILDQEEFEKICGIGEQFEELFGYAIWHESHTKSDILRLNEAERRKRKEEKERERKKAQEEEKAKIEEDKREAQRQKQLSDALEQAEKEAEEKTRAEKWRKLKEARKNEDESIKENREREDQLKEKRKEKKESDNKKKKQLRDLELRGVENACKKREEELQRKKDERYRKQRQEMAARLAERKESMLDLKTTVTGKKL